MLEGLLAALKGADPFEATHGVSVADAQRLLAQQWRELDRLAAADPAGYRRLHERMAREAGASLPAGFAERAEAVAGARSGAWQGEAAWGATHPSGCCGRAVPCAGCSTRCCLPSTHPLRAVPSAPLPA
jgi:hypothetical protein